MDSSGKEGNHGKNIIPKIKDTLISAKTLVVYRNILKDKAVTEFIQILEKAAVSVINYDLLEKYHGFYALLVDRAELYDSAGCGNLWQNHILNLLLADENGFSLKCDTSGAENITPNLKMLVKRDLAGLKKLYDFDFEALAEFMRQQLDLDGKSTFPALYNPSPKQRHPYPASYFKEVCHLKQLLSRSRDWVQNYGDLASFYKKVGCGIMGRFWAFKWGKRGDIQGLIGIAEPDPIRLEDLIGYEAQKKEVLRNTEQFVQGFSANNMLLYGDRGTGKSSTIKALLHEFGPYGLRMVEVTKYQMIHLQEIIAQLKKRPQRFIIFIDDLSFEEHETEYKYLKAILEGSLEASPDNVVIYATSNRRHLVREYTSDRGENEWKAQDTIQEKLSLSDRFGITVVYTAPDQEKYLEIVTGIAKNEGIDMDPAKLKELAVKWELWQNQKSGRTARQFVEDLKGKLGISKKNQAY